MILSDPHPSGPAAGARQALNCSAVAVWLMGRTEDETVLRDAVLLTAAGDDPGPAGREFLAYKRVSTRKPGFSSKAAPSSPIFSGSPGTIG
ncbi:hypothetical protein J2Y48_004619 [Mycoplana sp. BE70]|uniref:DUF1403 family protein n=1 Tax=Mycoplana sp. BE70 TaxID=2817775 RepID=UPI0028563D99|nr:DUF1403 family protein [Mycoplana sp. BE70]MDR6759303.1 hypothetical protein [Mycoplana sp. BE70]